MNALVLAAGLGTRLRPLTQLRAKPALPVLGIPSLWYGAWHLQRELKPKAFALNASHLPQTVRDAGNDPALCEFTGIDFHYSDESAGILGSSGALWRLSSWIGRATLAVCNGDTIGFPSWRRMLEFHRASKAAITLHARAHAGSAEAYTDLKIDERGRVTAFGEKATSGLMFSGSYLFEPRLLERLPPGASELRATLLEPLIRERKLFAFREDMPWFDTGSVASYAQTQFELLKKIPQARPLVERKMREVALDAWIPSDWSLDAAAALKLSGPVALTGGLRGWTQVAKQFGPKFIGIEPPPAGLAIPTSNAIVFSSQIEKL